MRIAKWAAIAVTVLLALANLGLLAQNNLALKIVGPILGIAAVVAVVAFGTGKPWGARAVIVVGVINLISSVVGAVVGTNGWPIGVVLAGLAIVLTASSRAGARTVATS